MKRSRLTRPVGSTKLNKKTPIPGKVMGAKVFDQKKVPGLNKPLNKFRRVGLSALKKKK